MGSSELHEVNSIKSIETLSSRTQNQMESLEMGNQNQCESMETLSSRTEHECESVNTLQNEYSVNTLQNESIDTLQTESRPVVDTIQNQYESMETISSRSQIQPQSLETGRSQPESME